MSDLTQKVIKIASDESNWQKELAQGVGDIKTLYQLLDLPLPNHWYEPKNFALRVPLAFVNKMKKGDAQDPLLLQVLPDYQEQAVVAGYVQDPLEESHQNPIKSLIHKYKSRALLTVTGACAIHCRYCFRQHFDYQSNIASTKEMTQIIQYLQNDLSVNEIILSGGDPLSINNRRLSAWFAALNDVTNIKTIRLHTRLPVVLPSRVDENLLALFRSASQNIVMVLHINHPNEIDEVLIDKCMQLKQSGVTLLNQSVLLKGINDSAEVLTQLSQKLFDAGVLPYYLHVLDKVAGAAHFDMSIQKAVRIYWRLMENLPGYLVPKLTQEVPNQPHKTPIDVYRYKIN